MIKPYLTTLMIGFCVSSSVALASSTNNCAVFLSSSDDSFLQSIQNDTSSAQNIATQLNACLTDNFCATSSIENCSTQLANRDFLSVYYAKYSHQQTSPGNYSSSGNNHVASENLITRDSAKHANTNTATNNPSSNYYNSADKDSKNKQPDLSSIKFY